MIEFKQFTKRYNNFKAVNRLDLKINEKEIVGFVGKNGAGKSTTIRAMLNLIHPTSGKILINGYDSVDDASKINNMISYVPSEPSYYNGLTGYDVLSLNCNLSNTSYDSMYRLAEYFELDLKKPIDSLSLGNRKKVAIINAFLSKTPIILLDEPTSGLDPLIQSKFFDLLLDVRNDGRTIFLSSHNLQEIEKYCDKVAIIKEGKLVNYLDMNNIRNNRPLILSCTLKDGRVVNQVVKDDINILISKLSKLDLIKLEIKYKTVEEEFMHYYKGDSNHE